MFKSHLPTLQYLHASLHSGAGQKTENRACVWRFAWVKGSIAQGYEIWMRSGLNRTRQFDSKPIFVQRRLKLKEVGDSCSQAIISAIVVLNNDLEIEVELIKLVCFIKLALLCAEN